MELREYWQIVRRRLWIVVSLVFVVMAVSVLLRTAPRTTYQATMRFVVGLEPEAKTGDYYTYDRYYTWLTAEYLIDDAAALVRSGAFAEAVSAHLADAGVHVPAGAIHGSTQAGQQHRILTVSVAWDDAEQLTAIANAVAAVLPEEIARHFAQVGTGGVHASPIDPPVVGAVGPGLRQKLDLPMRLVLALVVGLALAFGLDYLDDSVRDRRELEENGIAVLGEIPPMHHRSREVLTRRHRP